MLRGTRIDSSRSGDKRASGRDEGRLPNPLRRDYNFLSGELHPDITFSRASGATQTNSSGNVAFAPSNSIGFSEDFSNGWSVSGSSVTGASYVDPFGNSGVYLFKPSNNYIDSVVSKNATSEQQGASYVTSVYAKASGKNFLVVRDVVNSGSTPYAWFDLSTGTVGEVKNNGTATIEDVGNSWYRCSIKGTASSTTITAAFYVCNANNSLASTINGDDGILLFGAQVEKSFANTPSSYIKTISATKEQAPRFDYDHAASLSSDVTKSNPLGLLVEEARTNLQPNSSLWVSSTHSINNFNAITNNFAISPTGQRDAWRGECYDTGGAARHEFYTRYNKANSTQYTHSLYIKPFGSVTHLKGSDEGSSSRAACFDLVNCQVVSNGLSNQGATIEKITEDGWVRVSFTFTSVAANTDSFLYWAVGDAGSLVASNSIFANYNSGKGSGIFCWGVQQEAGAFPTSLINTLGSTATRAADIASVSGTAFSRFFKDAQGTFVVDAQVPKGYDYTGYYGRLFEASDGSSTDRIELYINNSEVPVGSVRTGNVGQTQSGGTNVNVSSGEIFSSTIGYKHNNTRPFTDNGNSTLDTDVSLPSNLSELSIGGRYNSIKQLNGWIRRLRYFNKRKSDSQLQKLTSQDKLLQRFKGAKAAHSLRALTDFDKSPCVSVRRSYDNSEKSWTPNQVSNGELEADFQSEKQTTLPLDVSVEADEMVSNGTFDDDISSWTQMSGATIAYSNGTINAQTTDYNGAQQFVFVKPHTKYRLTFDVTSTTTSTGRIYIGTSSDKDAYGNHSNLGVGSYSYDVTTIDNSFIQLRLATSASSGNVNFDNVSCKEVSPLATGFSTRKIDSSYTGKAMRCRGQDGTEVEVGFDDNNEISLSSPITNSSQNLFPSSEDFGINWALQTCTLENYSGLDPLGGTNATKITATGGASSGPYYIASVTTGKSHTLSVYIKAEEATRTRVGWFSSGSWVNVETNWSASGIPTTHTILNATNINYEAIGTEGGWYRVSLVGNTDSTSTASVNLDPDSGGNNRSAIFHGTQLEETQYDDGVEKITNGTFDTDSDWSDTSGVSISNGKLNFTITNGGNQFARQSGINYQVGKKYRLTAKIKRTSLTAGGHPGGVIFRDDPLGSGDLNHVVTLDGTEQSVSVEFTQTKYNKDYLHIKYNAGTTFTFEVDDVSLLEISPELQTYSQTPTIVLSANNTTATTLGEFSGLENLLTYSEDFSNGVWTKSGVTATPSNITDPFGGTNSFSVIEDTANSTHALIRGTRPTIQAGVHTLSLYLKSNGKTVGRLLNNGTSGAGRIVFDLTNKTTTVESGPVVGHSITELDNGWFRVSMDFTAVAGTSGISVYLQGTGGSWTGDGESGFYVFGMQVNTNTLKPYQATASIALTGDVNVVNWYDQGGGEDAVQDTASKQPRIVMGSELVTDNGKPSIRFDGVDDNFKLNGNQSLKSAFWYANVLEQNSSNDQSYAQVLYGTGSWAYAAYFTTSTNISYYGWYLDNGWRQGDPDPVMGNGHVMSQINSGTRDVYFNGGQTLNHATSSFTDGLGGMIGARDYQGGTNRNLDGNLSELLLYPSDMSNSRFQIEQNMLRHFEIYDYQSDFSVDADGITSAGLSNVSLTANVDNISGKNDVLRIDSHTGGRWEFRKTISLAQDKVYEITFDYLVSETNGAGGRYWQIGNAWINSAYHLIGEHDNQIVADGTWRSVTLKSKKNSADYLNVKIAETSGASYGITSGTAGATPIYITNIKVREVATDGYVTSLYDQSGNNCHALQSTAANQPQIVSGGDLIKSGNRPAWEYIVSNPQRNLRVQGVEDIVNLDAFFVAETSDAALGYPVDPTVGYRYAFVAEDSSTNTGLVGGYGSPILEINGVQQSLTTRDDVHTAYTGRKLVYHRNGSTRFWGAVDMGHFAGITNYSLNIENTKFSEWIWYDSDQHSNQSGIESNINSHYNIY